MSAAVARSLRAAMPPAAPAAAARIGRAALSSSRSVAEKQRRAIIGASGDLGAALGVGLAGAHCREDGRREDRRFVAQSKALNRIIAGMEIEEHKKRHERHTVVQARHTPCETVYQGCPCFRSNGRRTRMMADA